MTALGETCIPWTEGSCSRYSDLARDMQNLCRNQQENKVGSCSDEREIPWCLTSPNVWDFCWIPSCGKIEAFYTCKYEILPRNIMVIYFFAWINMIEE